MALEQPDRGLVDGRLQHLLHATEQQRHALDRLSRRANDRLVLRRSPRRQVRWHERERGGAGLHAERRYQPAERTCEPAKKQRDAEAAWARQHLGKKPARGPLPRRAPFLLDADAREIDEMHVVHPARAGGHAGEAGETPVDVVGDRRGDRALLEHLLDQVDAAARRIALIAEQHIGRAGGGAEAAMDAALEHGVGAGDGRVLELLVGEIGVHVGA